MKHEIKMSELLKMDAEGTHCWSKKDNSPRGCKTVSTSELNIGDKIVIDNYFTTIIDEEAEK